VITAGLARSTGELSGAWTSITNDQGFAVFNDVSIVSTGEHTVRLTNPDLNGLTSASIMLPPFELAFGLDQFELVRAGSFDMRSDGGFLDDLPSIVSPSPMTSMCKRRR